MSFNTALTKYDLVEKQAAAPTGGIASVGKVGYIAQFDVINSVNGDVIVSSTTSPRPDALAALTTASVAATAIITYRNGSGSVSAEMTLATAH
jgi:hypothetical protein